jgi:hypothetical protein
LNDGKHQRDGTMSNCIQVGRGFYPFRWVGEAVEAFIDDEWKSVLRTQIKNARGEFVFNLPHSKDGKMQLCMGCNKYVSTYARFCPRCNP